MVLREKNGVADAARAMAATADQPLKKKQRIDEYIDDDEECTPELLDEASKGVKTNGEDAVDCCPAKIEHVEAKQNEKSSESVTKRLNEPTECVNNVENELKRLQRYLIDRCLCSLDENILSSILESASFDETNQALRLLSTLELLLEVYLQMNSRGAVCTKVSGSVDALIRCQRLWLPAIAALSIHRNPLVTSLASKVLASFFLSAKDSSDRACLNRIVRDVHLLDHLDRITVQKISFSLDVIRRIVEWKDIKQHPLDDDDIPVVNNIPTVDEDNPFRLRSSNSASTSAEIPHAAFSNLDMMSSNDETELSSNELEEQSSPIDRLEPLRESENVQLQRINSKGCILLILTDSDSFDTSHIKCLTIKTLEQHWPKLVKHIKLLLFSYLNIANAENCILTFLSLWENIISVKANLSVIDTKPFYADLQSFSDLLRNPTLPPLIYTQLLTLLNEVLCYGSTLALQDILPKESCTLAHTLVRFVKDHLLSDIRIGRGRSGFSFIGFNSPVLHNYSLDPATANGVYLVDENYGHTDDNEEQAEVDRTMLQKIVLLILKSVAVTVKEMRCDSSDSSIDSSDYNAIQDMQIVERSIRDVLKKLDTFIRNALEFHPETPFAKMLIHLFSEQDDYLIESMVCTLDITVGIVYRNSMYPDLVPMLSPFTSFLEFLNIVSHHSDVLLDYLVSNETCFLLYLLRFLKYTRRNWSKFVEVCQEVNGGSTNRVLDEAMTVLIRLRLKISALVSRSLFPYNISPVLRLLEVCESLYEGNEFS